MQLIVDSAKFKHSQYVSMISGLLAEYMGYSESQAHIIKQAALFHDLGKCDIPPEILNKKGALTDKEVNIVKRHAKLGSDRIKEAVRVLAAACVIAKNHHEKLDGTGYHKLYAEEIHPYARLVSVADVFDALKSKRSYKEAWDINKVLEYFKEYAGIQFDESVVNVLLTHVDEILKLY